jgi:hypothetical protein
VELRTWNGQPLPMLVEDQDRPKHPRGGTDLRIARAVAAVLGLSSVILESGVSTHRQLAAANAKIAYLRVKLHRLELRRVANEFARREVRR